MYGLSQLEAVMLAYDATEWPVSDFDGGHLAMDSGITCADLGNLP